MVVWLKGVRKNHEAVVALMERLNLAKKEQEKKAFNHGSDISF